MSKENRYRHIITEENGEISYSSDIFPYLGKKTITLHKIHRDVMEWMIEVERILERLKG